MPHANRGKSRIPKRQKRDSRHMIGLTSEEGARYVEAADKSGLTTSEFGRLAVLAYINGHDTLVGGAP